MLCVPHAMCVRCCGCEMSCVSDRCHVCETNVMCVRHRRRRATCTHSVTLPFISGHLNHLCQCELDRNSIRNFCLRANTQTQFLPWCQYGKDGNRVHACIPTTKDGCGCAVLLNSAASLLCAATRQKNGSCACIGCSRQWCDAVGSGVMQ